MKHLLCLSLLAIAHSFMLSGQPASTLWSRSSTPNMPCFSSPRVAHLNADTVLDIIIGGGFEYEHLAKSVSAYDGATGDTLWQHGSRGQFFGSAVFQDITGDGIDDVFMNGRVAQLNAYNGNTGALLWEFYPNDTIDPTDDGWYNFYNMQWVPDLDDDGLRDILISNGGNHSAPSFDTINRPAGRLVLVSGGTGALINYAVVPDGRETYFSPLVHDFDNDGILDVIYGTGGEVLYGNLWRTTLDDILAGDLSQSVLLMHNPAKGFIPPPTLADITTDGVLDILVGGYDGRIHAFDGATNQILWQVLLPNIETNASPTIGQYTDDFIPDMFISVATGTAPSFLQTIQMMINGETGEVEWQDTLGFLSFATANAVDADGDGKDEVIMSLNYAGATFSHELLLIDFNDQTTTSLTGLKPSTNLASTPWVGDLDGDGLLDIVYTHNQVSNNFAPNNGYVIERLQTNIPMPAHVAFGAYMGTDYTGKYDNPYCQNFGVAITNTASPCANTAGGAIHLEISGGVAPYTITRNGIVSPPLNTTSIDFQNLLPGSYDITIADSEGCKLNRRVGVAAPPPISLELQLTQPSSPTATDGAIVPTAMGGTAPYQYQISGNAFNNLGAGTYTVSVTDANGCVETQNTVLGNVGIDAPEADGISISIQPNPTAQLAVLSVAGTDMPQMLYLYDLNGKQVAQQPAHSSHQNGIWQTSIDLRAVPPGLYALQVVTQQGSYTTRVVKQ